MTSEHVPMAAVPGQPSGDIRRGATLALLLLLALNLALRSYVSLRPLEAIDGLTIPDDAYLSLSIARNIAQGLGPQYGEQYTNGFQPFYVFLMVPVYWLIPHDPIMPVHLALLLTSLFDTLTLLILLRLVRRVSTSACTPILTALLWMLHPRIIGVATNGLETAIACFFVVWVLAYFHKHFLPAEHAPNRRDCVRLGVLLGLGMLARIDCIVLAAVVTALLLWMHGSARRGALAWAMVVNASMFLVYLPWLAYSYAYTGDFYPVSGSAVRLMTLARVDASTTFAGLHGLMARAALRAIAGPNQAWIACSAVLLLLGLAFRHLKCRPAKGQAVLLAASWGYAIALICAYVFYEFGPHFFDRYFHPVRVPLLLTIAILTDSLLSSFKRARVRAGAAILFAAFILASQSSDPYLRDLLFGNGSPNLGYMNLGLWARSTFPNGTVVGGSQTGAVGYFADNLKVVNLDGVVNKRCYESLVHRANMKYVRGQGIEYVFGWAVNFAYLVHMSNGFKQGDIADLKKIPGFQSWNTDWYVGKVSYDVIDRATAGDSPPR
jgi:hypothetical protein